MATNELGIGVGAKLSTDIGCKVRPVLTSSGGFGVFATTATGCFFSLLVVTFLDIILLLLDITGGSDPTKGFPQANLRIGTPSSRLTKTGVPATNVFRILYSWPLRVTQ